MNTPMMAGTQLDRKIRKVPKYWKKFIAVRIRATMPQMTVIFLCSSLNMLPQVSAQEYSLPCAGPQLPKMPMSRPGMARPCAART